MGSCVLLHIMSVELAPHCWNATSLADPEYVMDFRSPNAFCALAITVFASCAMALPHRNARQIATLDFLNTASPLFSLIVSASRSVERTHSGYSISTWSPVLPISGTVSALRLAGGYLAVAADWGSIWPSASLIETNSAPGSPLVSGLAMIVAMSPFLMELRLKPCRTR